MEMPLELLVQFPSDFLVKSLLTSNATFFNQWNVLLELRGWGGLASQTALLQQIAQRQQQPPALPSSSAAHTGAAASTVALAQATVYPTGRTGFVVLADGRLHALPAAGRDAACCAAAWLGRCRTAPT